MGLGKFFYTAKNEGENIPAHVLIFFGEKGKSSPKKKKVKVVKKDNTPTEKFVDEILKDLMP